MGHGYFKKIVPMVVVVIIVKLWLLAVLPDHQPVLPKLQRVPLDLQFTPARVFEGAVLVTVVPVALSQKAPVRERMNAVDLVPPVLPHLQQLPLLPRDRPQLPPELHLPPPPRPVVVPVNILTAVL